MDYRVVWEIDIEAESFKEAAEIAREIQRDPESLATYFTITAEDGKSEKIEL